MPRPSRSPSSELAGWSLLGIAIGFVAGVVLAEWLGPVGSLRPARREGEPEERSPRRLTSGGIAARVREAIARDPVLGGLALTVMGIAPGIVEVRGWVEDRAARARVSRLVRSLAGVDSLVNSILVHGEDDPPPTPTLQLSDRTA